MEGQALHVALYARVSSEQQVQDATILSQVASLRDWYQNRFTRVLLVGFAVTVGSRVAAVLGVLWLLCAG